MSRRVLLLQSRGSPVDLRPVLAVGKWNPVHIVEPDLLSVESAAGGCRVGIAVIENFRAFDESGLSGAISRSGIEWIAIARPGASQDPSCAGVLSAFFDFHTLPIDPRLLLFSLGHAFGKASLRRPDAPGGDLAGTRFGMVGTSRPMLALFRKLEKVVRVDAPVLISGESGTGKELAAIAIHRGSRRREGPFVAVNCGAIPPSLIQAQLFGHEKGSFTGAHQRGIGSLEAAAGGTIFLDEIGDLPLESQASLLRFMQESTIVRLGSTRTLKIDARVIAASNIDLGTAVRERRFRDDLYYRLNVLHLEMPALRSRREDIEPLAQHVFERYRADCPPGVRGLSKDSRLAMQAHSWPGNVRELINRVHNAMIMCEGPWIQPGDLGLDSARRTAGHAISLADARLVSERDVVLAALERNTHNMAATARELGVSRVTLYRLTRRLAIQPLAHEASTRPTRYANGATVEPG